MTNRPSDVFTPGLFPKLTYVARDKTELETKLRMALATPGTAVSLSGPSKGGKTVLVERIVGLDNLISISGASIHAPGELWNRVLDWIGEPASTETTTSTAGATSFGADVRGNASIPLVASGEIGAKVEATATLGHEARKSYVRGGLQQVVREIGNSDFVVLLDDFHYIRRDLQIEVAKEIKEGVRLGIKIVVASVPHRADDVVRANPELRGRVTAIDVGYWSLPDLSQIAKIGFPHLGRKITIDAVHRFAMESAGSPQLMQAMCLRAAQLAEITELGEPIGSNVEFIGRSLRMTADSYDFRIAATVMNDGPKTRGVERKLYRFVDGSEGDVYRCLLRAIAVDPPQLSFPYAELQRRMELACPHGAPIGASVTGSCHQIAQLLEAKLPNEQLVDWNETSSLLDIAEPHLLFYLRWSDFLAGTGQ